MGLVCHGACGVNQNIPRFAQSSGLQNNPGACSGPLDSHRRYRVQFRLRSLCVTVMFAALACNAARIHLQGVQQQQQAAAFLSACGAQIIYEDELHFLNPEPVGPAPDWLSKWIGEDHFRHVASVDLCGVEITDEQLDQIANLRGVKHLYLTGESVTDLTLDRLASLRSLQSLCLTGTSVSEDGIRRWSQVRADVTLRF